MTKSIRHFLDLADIPVDTLKGILASAHRLKKEKFHPPQLFSGLSLAMVFDKRSTRTRMSFEVAMKQLGGHVIVMTADDMHLTGAESIEDTSRVLSRYVDAAMFRISSHEKLLEIAGHSTIPVINGLTNHSHPCQIMADLMTIEEKLGSVQGKKIAWFGDYNNVARTIAQASKIWNFEMVVAVPADLAPSSTGGSSGGIVITQDAAAAAKGADVIITDTWISMGQEGKDIKKFLPFQVNPALMAKAKKGAIFMHCMPVHRGEEVTNEVLSTSASVIYDEAENRLHAQKAILAWCLEGAGVKLA
jgi:ornithine carbamoyltransferase